MNPESRYWSQLSTSADNNTYCVGALWDSGQGGLVHSMGVWMNVCAAWLSLHYLHSWTTWKFFSIIYWLRALFGSGGREREEVGKRRLCICVGCVPCHAKLSPSCLMGKMKFVCLFRLHRMELDSLQRCRMSVFVLQQMLCSFVHLALFLFTCHVSFWKKLSSCSRCCFKMKGWDRDRTHCQMLDAISIKNKPFVLC